MKAIEKAWKMNLQLDKDDQWENKEAIISERCPCYGDFNGINLKEPKYCPKDDEEELCTKCWNREVEEDKLTFNKLEISPVSNINLDGENEEDIKESLKRNDYIVCADNSFDYNKIPLLIKWLQDVYDYCTEIKNKVEYVDFETAKKHMNNGNKAMFEDETYYIKNGELYCNETKSTVALKLRAIESDKWILL